MVLFIKIIEANFRSMERDFEEREEGAKCLLLITNTSGEAQEWISRQSTEIQESWARLIGGLTTRFPKVAKVDQSQYTLQRLIHPKQKGRSLEDYFDEVRNIERDLPPGLESQVANQMVAGLDSACPV